MFRGVPKSSSKNVPPRHGIPSPLSRDEPNGGAVEDSTRKGRVKIQSRGPSTVRCHLPCRWINPDHWIEAPGNKPNVATVEHPTFKHPGPFNKPHGSFIIPCHVPGGWVNPDDLTGIERNKPNVGAVEDSPYEGTVQIQPCWPSAVSCHVPRQ
jgi:hypothetical protein